MSQLRNVEARLDGVEVVQTLGAQLSPYDGRVKKIKWINQTNQELAVEVALMVQE